MVVSESPVSSTDSGSGGAATESVSGMCTDRVRVSPRLWKSTKVNAGRLSRQPKAGDTAGTVGSVFEHQSAAMAFGDLPAEHQADARTARLGGKEGDEQIRRGGES